MKMSFRPAHSVLLLFSIAIAGVFSSLFETGPGGDWKVRSYSVWGDWSAHLSFISAFRERGTDWVTGANPLFHEASFRYPFLSHLLTAWIAEITKSDSLVIARALSMILLLALPFVLYRFYRTFHLGRTASVYSCALFLFLGGFQIFDRTLPRNAPVTNQFDSGSVFTQPVLFELMPQRAFLFGMVLFLILIARMVSARSKPGKSAWVAAIFAGLLPLVHLHSWLALGALLLALLAFPARNRSPLGTRRSVLVHGLLILAISGPLAAALLVRETTPAGLTSDFWFPGWAQNEGAGLPRAAMMNPIWFWLYNTGMFLPLLLGGVFLLMKKPRPEPDTKGPELHALGLAGGVLFAVAMLFKIQPYFYDNLKILTWAFLFLAPFAGLTLAQIHQRLWPLAIGIGILQSASAVRDFSFFWNTGQPVTWLESVELDLAREFKMIRASPDDLVLIQPRHNHWVPMLTGNPVFMGYAGWLWSWGIDYQGTEQKINRILLGESDAETLMQEIQPRWIVLDRRTQVRNRAINLQFFESHYRKVLERDAWVVYSNEPATRSPSRSVRRILPGR